jgi:hypothetical protein
LNIFTGPALLLFIVQTLLIKELKFTILANLILLTTLTILLSSFESNIENLMLWTILSAALRVNGHFFEPSPPFLIDNRGQFSPINLATLKKLRLVRTIALLLGKSDFLLMIHLCKGITVMHCIFEHNNTIRLILFIFQKNDNNF